MTQALEQAFEYRKAQNYQKAVEIYTPLWKENPNRFNDWAGWSYGFSLSKLNRHEEALEICRALYPRYKSVEILNSLYAKCIYYTQFATTNPQPLETLRKAADGMFKLAPPNNPYSFTPRAVFRLIKVLLNQQMIPWREIEEWLLRMDPDLLDDRPFSMTGKDGKKIDLASPREEWYSNMIRVKGGLGKPQELLDTIESAQKQGIRWHYNNDLWFDRKKAFAYKELGRKGEAEKILRNIVRRKNDWFLLADLAGVIDDREEVLQLLCTAAISRGDNQMKVKVFEGIFHLLKDDQQYQREAALHMCLLAALREENQWPEKPEMIDEITKRGINPQEEGSSSNIIKTLMPFWRKNKTTEFDNRHNGVVVKIFPGNTSGIIESGKSSYYTTFHGLRSTPQEGLKVTFELKDSFDKKKNRASKMAIKLKEIKS